MKSALAAQEEKANIESTLKRMQLQKERALAGEPDASV